MSDERKTVWLTHACLTKGVGVIESRVIDPLTGRKTILTEHGFINHQHVHYTRAFAIRCAEMARQEEIERLEKQLEYLKSVKFENV